ncbi:hypothetical protein [Paenibacillus ihuae]|uniref:hypothetical protein n=1 Tax=Paenibacillus ihuae TaxID=1232431 RepID=UPI000A43AB35|nr:hypothetical protein [Paenibacillus ihuae]
MDRNIHGPVVIIPQPDKVGIFGRQVDPVLLESLRQADAAKSADFAQLPVREIR